jgi:hypothetical protein
MIMKRYFLLTLLLGLMISSCFEAHALDNTLPSNGVESIEWQKIKLQDSIRRRYESVISKVITSSKFIVNVKLETVNMDKIKAPKPKDEFKSVKQVKFNNNPTNDTKGDSIIFSKLGLEAPLIQDEDNYKRESIKKTISDITTNFDIFNYLQSVSVEVLLNEKLEIKTRKVVEDLILGTQALNTQKIKPRTSIKYIPMEENFVMEKKVEPTLMEKVAKLAPKYANAIGLILSVFIFGIVATFLFKKYFDLQEKQMELLKSQVHKSEQKNINDNKGDVDGKGGEGGGAGDVISEEESVKAFERFRDFLTISPVEAQLLIKKWIKAEDDLSKLALNSLVKQLTNDELKGIFDMLTLNERKAWKAKLKVDLNDEEIRMGNAFISSQTVDDIIAPPMIKDPELLKIIAALTPKQGAEIAQANTESGSILMNIMPPKFLAEMMEEMPTETIDSIISMSATSSEEEIALKLESFKDQLPAMQAAVNRSPFMENITAHIAFATPTTERALFKLLAAFEPIETVVQTAIANLPVEVINKVPEKIVRASLQTFPQLQRIQYFFVQDPDKRTHLLNLFAAEGSKARELIMFEFEKIQNDPQLLEDVEKNKSNLEKAYFQSVRKLVRNSPEVAKDVKPIVMEWIDQLLGSAPDHANESTDEMPPVVSIVSDELPPVNPDEGNDDSNAA